MLNTAKQSKYDLVCSFVLCILKHDDNIPFVLFYFSFECFFRASRNQKMGDGKQWIIFFCSVVVLIHFVHIIDLCMPPFYLQSEQKHHWKVHKIWWKKRRAIESKIKRQQQQQQQKYEMSICIEMKCIKVNRIF